MNEATQQENDLEPDALEALEHANKTGEFPVDIDDDDWYGDAVKKRINKEVGKRKKLEERLDEFESETGRVRAELKEARERLSRYEESEDKALNERVDDLKARAKKALDDGELEMYHELNNELMDAKISVSRKAVQPRQVVEPEPPKQDKPKIANAAADWLERNSDWVEADEEKAAHAAKIEKQLFKEGYTANDPDTYRELDRRLSRWDEDDEPVPISGGVPRDTGTTRPRQKGLTKADLQKMQTFGLDPNNPEHRKGWLKRNNPL